MEPVGLVWIYLDNYTWVVRSDIGRCGIWWTTFFTKSINDLVLKSDVQKILNSFIFICNLNSYERNTLVVRASLLRTIFVSTKCRFLDIKRKIWFNMLIIWSLNYGREKISWTFVNMSLKSLFYFHTNVIQRLCLLCFMISKNVPHDTVFRYQRYGKNMK